MVQDDTDSESGRPETVSLSSSASAARGHNRALRNFHAAEKQKAKAKNRRRDERFKAQADIRWRVTAASGRGKYDVGDHEVDADDNVGVSGSDSRHQRMTRAMGDAEEETEEHASGGESGEEWDGINIENEQNFRIVAEELEDVEMLKGEEREKETQTGHRDLDTGEGESNKGDLGALQSLSSKYLPDHVFLAALSKPKAGNDVRPPPTTPKTRPLNRRQYVHARAKDVAVGTRTVRTLSSSPTRAPVPLPGTTLPPVRIQKFLTNALALHGAGKRVSKLSPRWERRPPHLGVLKRTTGAPTTGFARAS
ncbi:hypothetical protein BJV78DRAFT_939020 [Lactifluus subvellereus]|nr:hypothetical protein BJV78DRAFT_939020 [Lactifluus subvellereus]